MNRKDILELKRRFKKDECTFTKMCGCYVNGEKDVILRFRETFLNLPDEEYYKYLEIAKKVLSGTIGNNLLELTFPLDEQMESRRQVELMRLKRSALKDDRLLDDFYQSIIDSLDHAGNFLILIFHDAYDVMTKTSDNLKLDESEEVYEYVLCAICPVDLAKPGLSYIEKEQRILPRIRDWVVAPPILGFTYPGFIDRSTDVNALMYYTKNAKDPHPELMADALGCAPRTTATIQKASFEEIIKEAVSDQPEEVYVEIQENLNTLIEEHKEIYEDTNETPITLTKETMQEILKDSGITEEASSKIKSSFEETFSEEPPLAESLIDKKVIKANEHKKKEEALIRQVEALETKLEEAVRSDEVVAEEIETPELEEPEENENDAMESIDVVLHVNPSKLSEIKTEIINGQKCIVVPVKDHELTSINGQRDLL